MQTFVETTNWTVESSRETPVRAFPHQLVPQHHLPLTSERVFFTNLNLNSRYLEKRILPLIELLAQRLTVTYKTPSKIEFLGVNGIFKSRLSDWLQFDDVTVKLLHLQSGLDILITLSTKIARTLIIRLLSTTLIDDSHGVLFSSTEKGIFSFILARLLLDIKNTLGSQLHDLKLIGIYHCQDEAIIDTPMNDYGVLNFTFDFANDTYPVSLALPLAIFSTFKPEDKVEIDLIRCGHISAPFIFTLKQLRMSQADIASLSFGDLIIFDHCNIELAQQKLHGTLNGTWQNLAVKGKLTALESHYQFNLDFAHGFTHIEDISMEHVDIINTENSNEHIKEGDIANRKLMDLAKNIRVTLNIELSRIPITLKAISEIKEGEIIDLHRKIEDPLDMVVEGKLIGQCQPVQIDGRLGIRVLSIDGDTQQQH